MKSAGTVWVLLLFVSASHLLVDAIAGIVTPLWPSLETEYRLEPWQSACILFVWQMTTSLGQLFFGVWGDRHDTRWLLWAGPIVALISLGSIGWGHSRYVLAIQLAVGGLAIASFHPEGAALAGNCATTNRSRAMSLFSLGGFIGQAIGPIYSGQVVDRLGLTGLAWTIPIGILATCALLPLGLANKANISKPVTRHKSVRLAARSQTRIILTVLLVGSLRLIAASGVPVLVSFLMKARGSSAGEIGLVQSGFMVGIGIGGLVCGTLIRAKHEWIVLWISPCLVSPVLLCIPYVFGTTFAVIVAVSGALLGTSIPVLVSFGQQLMPDAQRLASSITMGASWGVGGAAVAAILAVCSQLHHYETAFFLFAIATGCSAILCVALPREGRAVRAVTSTHANSRAE